jgi:hypothetical protein
MQFDQLVVHLQPNMPPGLAYAALSRKCGTGHGLRVSGWTPQCVRADQEAVAFLARVSGKPTPPPLPALPPVLPPAPYTLEVSSVAMVKCPKCSKQFKDTPLATALTNHLKTKHGDSPPPSAQFFINFILLFYFTV